MASDSSCNLSADISVFDTNISHVDNQKHQWFTSSSPWEPRLFEGSISQQLILRCQESLLAISRKTFCLRKILIGMTAVILLYLKSQPGTNPLIVLLLVVLSLVLNSVVAGGVESSSVMGGTSSWPALSESTKPTSKSSSDISKPSIDGLQPTSSSQVPIVSETLQQQVNSNVNVSSNSTHGLPRQRSVKRGSGGGTSNGPGSGPPQVVYNRSPPPPPPLPPSFPAMGLLPPYGSFVAPILDTPPPVRGVRPMGGLRPQSGSDLSSPAQRSPKRNGFGPRPRGDVLHNHTGGRRDSDRVNNQFIPPVPYIPPPPPPGSASFIAPPNMRPFMTPMGYDMTSPYMIVPTLGPEPFRGIPFLPQGPASPLFYPTPDMHLPNMIVKQIDYYFSDENLVRDSYLRSNMDGEGWVPIDLIANFPRVQQMTTDIQVILESLRTSTVVEVQGNKIRRREDWEKWVHKNSRASAVSGTQPPPATMSSSGLSASIRHLSLNVDADNTSSQ